MQTEVDILAKATRLVTLLQRDWVSSDASELSCISV